MTTDTQKIIIQVKVQGQKDLEKLDSGTKKTTKSVGILGGGFTKLAAQVTSAVVAFRTMNKVISFGIKTFRDFEFQMSKVRAITGASNQEFKALSESAQDLGRTTFFTAQQVAELQTNYGKLGFTTDEILKAQEATLNLATATGSDLGRAATVAGAAVRGFGLDAAETQRVVDVMAVAFTSSAMDIEKWQTSMTKVAPIAKASGFSIEDTAAMMAKLTDAGIEASIAGTSLRNILLKMQDPSSELTKSFGSTVHGLDQLVPAMKKFVKEGGSMADIMEVVDLRQAAAFEQMLTSTDATVELRDALNNANGAAQEMADIVGDNLEGAFRRFRSAIEGLAIVIMDSLVGKAMQKFIDMSAKVINNITLMAEGFESQNEKLSVTAGLYKEQADKAKELRDRYNRLKEPIKLTNEELEQEAELLEELGVELGEVERKVMTVTEREAEQKEILKKLREEYGDTVVSIDDATGALILNASALDDVINRTLLLADTEALKLYKQLQAATAAREEIDKLIEPQEKLAEQEREKLEIIPAVTDQIQNQIRQYHALEQQTGENINNDTKLVETEAELNALYAQQNIALEKENKIRKQLIDAGYTEEEIERALLSLTKKSTTNTNERTNALKGLNRELTELQKLQQRNKTELLQIQTDLVDEILAGNMTIEESDRGLALARKMQIQDMLKDETLSYEKRVELENELAMIKLKNFQQEKANQKQLQAFTIDYARQTADIMFQLDSENRSRSHARDMELLEARLESGVISQEQYEKESEALNKEAFKKQKRMATLQAIINTALGITNVLGSKPPHMVPLKIGIITSLGAAQIAMIQSQQFARGGMVNGKSHSQGGEKFAVGGRVVELEGGEAVINKKSSAMFRNQLSAMNVAGGGVKFADGGLLNMPSFAQEQFAAASQEGMMGALSSSSRVVVLESDITNSQNTVETIQTQAGF